MKKTVLTIAFAVGLAACGKTTETVTTNVDLCQVKPWVNGTASAPLTKGPDCTVAVNFSMNDTANGVFLPGEAHWKGSFNYDALTRIAYYDSSWGGPYVPLYDDGPWTTGGHEPIGSTAGDHIFGATVFVSNAAQQVFGYGLIDHAFNDGWIWRGADGSFTVTAGATTAVTATGISMLPFGTTDLRLTLDTHNLAANNPPWDTTGPIQVKGSAFAWNDLPMYDDGTHGDTTAGDGVYTFVLSEFAGAGKLMYHTGLTASGDQPQFVFAFGAGHLGDATYKEYKVDNAAQSTGVAAAVKAAGASVWTAVTVETQASGNLNTFVTIP